MKYLLNTISHWPKRLLRVAAHELKLVFKDEGVIIFFVLVCLIYPVLYSLVYNPEIPRNIKVLVVDDDRSAASREFVRALDATPEVWVRGYAASVQEARHAIGEHECYGIIHFPSNYSRNLGRGEQAHINVYCDMSALMHYRQIVVATTGVQQALSAHLQQAKMAVVPMTLGGGTIDNEQVALGNTGMGLASAVLPCILIVALQQSMLLGIGMLYGGVRDRRRRNGGIDPLNYRAPAGIAVLGRAIAHLLVYVVPTFYALLLVPKFFDFPQNGNMFDIIAMTLPYLLAASFMGQTFKVFVKGREATFLTLVFTSVVFVFLSGISWPRSSMSLLWLSLGNLIPSTWAVNAYIGLQTSGASLSAQAPSYSMLWLLVAFYYVAASIVEHYITRRHTK